MARIDIETKKRQTLEKYEQLIKVYNAKQQDFQSSIEALKDKKALLTHATALLDCILSYKTIIEKDINETRKFNTENSPNIETVLHHIKTIETVLPAIELSKALMSASTTEELNEKSRELLNYIKNTLEPNPTWKHRVDGAFHILGGILLAAAGLAAAGLYFSVLLSPVAPLALLIIFPFFGSLFGVIGTLAGTTVITSGINTFMDRDSDRAALRDKLITFHGAFFNQDNEASGLSSGEINKNPLVSSEI